MNFMKLKQLLRLGLQFFKFGLFTFGGGWSIVAQMQEQYVEKEKLLSGTQLVDITSVGRSLPGAMICNVAMIFGYQLYGIVGGIICVVSLTIPPLVILSVFAVFYEPLMANVWLRAAFYGIRAAVGPIIFSAVVKLCGSSFKFPACIPIAVACFVLYCFCKVNCVLLVALGAAMGLAVCEVRERRRRG